MTKKQQFMEACHEVTQFCLARGGKCFKGWSKERVFLHIGSNALAGTLFVVRDHGIVKAIGIAQPTSRRRMFIGEVIGSRETCRVLFRRVMARWPRVRRFFAYRLKGTDNLKLVEFNPLALRRFCE